MPLKPLKSLKLRDEPLEKLQQALKNPGHRLQGQTESAMDGQRACAWFVWQRTAFRGGLTPLFAKPGEGEVTLEPEKAIAWVASAVGIGSFGLKYLHLTPFYSPSFFTHAMGMRHCSLPAAMEFEWEQIQRLQSQRRKMTPEAEVIEGLVTDLAIPPQIAKLLADVSLEATMLMATRTVDHARAVDTEVYRHLGKEALLTGDSRTALASQRAMTVTQGSAKPSASGSLTLDQIFRTMRELDNPMKDPDPLSLTAGDEATDGSETTESE